MTTTQLRRWSVQDYHRMVETGILQPDEHVELIEGQIFQMAPKGPVHSAVITRIGRILGAQLGERVLLRFQDPIHLSDDSEPEPDIAVVHPHPLDYEDHHPTPEEVYFLIEVADRTMKRDKDLKAPVYARSNIQEYWILDVNAPQLLIFREPFPQGYQQEMRVAATEFVRPIAFPDIEVWVEALLSSRSLEGGT